MAQVELIGSRVRLLREARRLDAASLASRASISRAHVYRIEEGERPNVSAVTVGRLARALGTSADYLIGLTDDPSPLDSRPNLEDPYLKARLLHFEQRFAQLNPDDQAAVLDVVFALLQFRSRVEREGDIGETDEEAEPEEAEAAGERPAAARHARAE
jgi:transcriptional regulator with XRE-family HTH domain